MVTYKGWESKAEIGATAPTEDNNITYMESISFNRSDGLEEVFEIGSRPPKEIKEGNVTVTGTITRKLDTSWTGGTGGTEKFYQIGGGSTTAALTSYYLYIYPAGYDTAGLPEIRLGGVKFHNYHIEISQDGYAVESMDYIVTTLSYGTTA